MRIALPVVFAVFFIGWLIYHGLIARDLKKHLNDLYFGCFFFGVWVVIYYFFFT